VYNIHQKHTENGSEGNASGGVGRHRTPDKREKVIAYEPSLSLTLESNQTKLPGNCVYYLMAKLRSVSQYRQSRHKTVRDATGHNNVVLL